MNIEYKSVKKFNGQWTEDIALNFLKITNKNFIGFPENLKTDKIFIVKALETNKFILPYTKEVFKDEEMKILLYKYIYETKAYNILLAACRDGNEQIVKILLEDPEINPNYKNNYGNTALICSAVNKNIEIIKLLLQHPKIDINIKNKLGHTALFSASFYGHTEIVRLLKNHANKN